MSTTPLSASGSAKHSATPMDELLALLEEQRSVLLRSDPAAVADLELGTARIEQALSQLAALARQAGPGAVDTAGAAPSAAVAARLRDELQANRAMLATLASGNRRALHALFGEPSLYGK